MDWSIISNIPATIAGGIAKLRELFPSNIYMIIAGLIAVVSSYYFLKQWIVSSVWLKLSTMLNFLLMALLIFLLLTRVG
jgi:hypothetical protein